MGSVAEPVPEQKSVPSRLFFTSTIPPLSDFVKTCNQRTNRQLYPNSDTVVENIPVYDLANHSSNDAATVTALQDEWYHILHRGAGVVILKNFEQDNNLIDQINQVYDSIITTEERSRTGEKGDHFAASGKNSRIWNSFTKHALTDPATFIKYYSNPWLNIVSTTWLGPHHQITAQVNIVRPQGKPQQPHRDYHLGFQIAESCAQFPKHIQIASQFLTLQGAVAHSDMPLESGPTRFLPFSQTFEEGYLAYRQPEFARYFEDNWVSAPLSKGDAVFFNPALFHAAGENQSRDIHRSANLLQISSAFGKTMESIDHVAVIDAVYDDLVKLTETEDEERVTCAIAAVANGYPFPTNLDRRPPAPGEMAPESQAKALTRCLLGSKGPLGKEETIKEMKRVEHESRDV